MGGTVSDQLTFQWVQGSIVKERKTFAGSLFLGKNGPKIKKATKNQEATRKYHVYSIVPCFAPHAASKTLCSFLPFSCVTNLLETLELGEVFFPRFYVDYAVPTEEHLGSTADAVTNLVSPRSVGKRGRSSAEDQRNAPVGCIGGILPLASGIFV